MRGSVSPSTHRRYPLTMICGMWRRARSSVYLALAPPRPAGPPAKRGPKTRVSDAELVTETRAVLAASPFHGEGYRKIRARLAHRGVAVSGKRVLRLLRQHGLLAPPSVGPGTIRRAAEGPRRVISRKTKARQIESAGPGLSLEIELGRSISVSGGVGLPQPPPPARSPAIEALRVQERLLGP